MIRRAVILCTLYLVAGSTLAGPLNPPAGPVGSTYKTLSDVEPRTAINATNTPGDALNVFKITQPGSYYLTGNVTVPSGMTGILAVAYDVTIDLNGFEITGAAGSIDGISSGAINYRSVTVRNGTVSGLGRDGVNLYAIDGGSIEQVKARGCGRYGLVSGTNGIMERCTAHYCTVAGLNVYLHAIARDCNAASNAGDGFLIAYDASASHCTSTGNAGKGFNAASANGSMDHCLAEGNLTGFQLGNYSVLEQCRAMDNTGVGVRAANNCTIRECLVAGNVQQGIYVDNYCTVSGNQVRDNGGTNYAGIWLSQVGNRCEDNSCTGNGYGVYVSATDNLVFRNSCRNNTQLNFQILNAASNEVAPVITNPGSNSFSTMTPWSNIAY